ncbi:uncharacterized protein N7483_006444 [Penicillium malachiteum]|uniref:uncharacterized protein n=1 Tax=Penicillium malachiteum TaxID=1324776 RepID=UPI00254909BE|nr:uncharacterized protein N7483_006444 [Penicillium malachiteum]KAJ5725087.1 hypothetical protein N7483_006444 [Penicillium malachiteum]
MTEPGPLRVLVIVSQRSSLISKARQSPQDLIPLATHLLKKNGISRGSRDLSAPMEPRLVAVQQWRTRVFIVFDIAHTEYNVKLGHLPEHNQLPVVVTHFSKKKTAYTANPWVSRRVNHDVAMLHNANGFDAVPPFVEDHSSGVPPSYNRPRDISMLQVTYI